MDQDIKIEIAGRKFDLKASSPEMESYMRYAAADINKMLERFDEKYPDKDREYKLLFAMLNQGVARLSAVAKLNSLTGEYGKLAGELSSYLESIDNR